MIGVIIGDLCGSIYEFDQVKNCEGVKMKNVIEDNAFFSDDSILTIAILDSILNKKDYGQTLREYAQKYSNYMPNFSPYFQTIFSPGFSKWALSDETGKSKGNGAMMRISPVGFMFETEQEVIENARLATIPSHNDDEAVSCATTIALIIFYARKGLSKEEIIDKLKLTIKKPIVTKFNYTCSDTIDICLYSFFKSNGFENALEIALSFGGDTDTNCAIVGGMAEAFYGVDKKIKQLAFEKIPENFCLLLNHAYKILAIN